MQQVLEHVVTKPPTYEMYMADVIGRGWLRFYEQGVLEIVHSAQRLTSPVDSRVVCHKVTSEELQGITVAHINSDNFVSIIHDATSEEDVYIVDTILPWYLATTLTFRSLFFEFRLIQAGRTLCLSDVVIDQAYFRVTR